VTLLVLLPISSSAQDSHYWSHQYGARATLLGGAVIGSTEDLSSVYYDPGGLAMIENLKVVVAARVIESQKYTLTTGLGQNLELSNERQNPVPTLVAGVIPFKWLGKNRLAYSLLVRQKAKIELKGLRIESRDVIQRTPGMESFVGSALLAEDLTEVWGGLSWAYKIRKNMGIGITQFVAYRKQSAGFDLTAQALTSTNELAVTIQESDYDYNHYRMLWKAGLSIEGDNLDLGATVTTPSIGLFGSGSLGTNTTVTGQDIDGDGNLDSELTSGFSDGLDSEYKSPFSVAVGGAYTWNRSTFHASVEWFDDIGEFNVVGPESFVSQSTGETVSSVVTNAADDVTNYALGLAHKFSSVTTGYASFTSDFTTFDPDAGTNLSITNWDIYHITGGVSTRIRKSLITLGFGYSYGSEDARRPIDFTSASESNRMIGIDSSGRFKYRGYRIIVGLSL
jgi:hypothetical protein